MRYVFVLLLVVHPSVTHAGERLTPRPVDPVAAEVFARACRDSITVRTLVDALESADVIVHIESSWTLPAGINGMTRFVVSRGGYRYLRITIPAGLPPRGRTALLAHELQHAVEVARSTAHDKQSLRRLFEREGHRSGEFYETSAAIRIEHKVGMELRAKPIPTGITSRQGSHPDK